MTTLVCPSTFPARLAITTSTTTLTIPTFPIGGQLSALALTVGLNLIINAGDPVTIADATGNNKMQGYVTSYTPASGALVVQIGSTFVIEIRCFEPPRGPGGGDYVTWWDFGTMNNISPRLAAALGVGTDGSIFIVDSGIIQVRFPEVNFKKLHLATYMVGMVMFDGADTRQLFIAELPVLYGGVTQ